MSSKRFLRGVALSLLAIGVTFVAYRALNLVVPVNRGEPRYSPSGEHYLQVSAKPYHGLMPRLPCQGSDRSGFIIVYRASGEACGRVSLPMVWMAQDLVWERDRAYLPGVAEWNLATCSVEGL